MSINKLDSFDLTWALKRLPKELVTLMKDPSWEGKIFIGGGYLRAIVAGEKINDIDVFVGDKKDAEHLSLKLSQPTEDHPWLKVIHTDNAYTIKSKPVPIQIIHRWLFNSPEDISDSFDFTVCCAVIYFQDGKWKSYCDDRFYIDNAAKRLVYKYPQREEAAGGSMLRVLKYYQKGYRIPLDSLGGVIARIAVAVKQDALNEFDIEGDTAKVITGLLREVDPAIDPEHLAHLPSSKDELNITEDEDLPF